MKLRNPAPKSINPLHTELPVIYLKPGEVYFSEKPELVYTLLGSCVSIVMYNPKFKIAAISHSLLPQNGRSLGKNKFPVQNLQYVDEAFEAMYNWFYNKGVKNHDIILKVFGGGNVIQINGEKHVMHTIGSLNIDKAMQLIHEKNLEISAIDVGGNLGRKLFFYTHTGTVLIKMIKKER